MENSQSQEAERLQLRMQRIRRRLNTDVEDLMSDAQQLLDWKYYLRRHPLTCLFGVAAIGFFIVPKGERHVENKVFLDPATSRQMMENTQQASVPQPAVTMSRSILTSIGALALNTAVRAGLAYAGNYLQQRVAGEFTKAHRP